MDKYELLNKAKEMYVSNEMITLKEISLEIGIHSETISKFLKSEGVNIRRGFNPKIDIYNKGLKEYKNGKSIGCISRELGICRNRFSQFLKKNGIEVEVMRHKKSFKNDVFNVIDTEEKAYWLGFLYADGSIRSGNRKGVELSLSCIDKQHIYKFRDFLKSNHKISLKESKLGNAYRISVEDKIFYDDLIKHGCTARKSLTLTFPDESQVPVCLHRHFIRGYFDGDGGMCFTDKTTSINILGTYEFLSILKTHVDILEDKKLYPIRYDGKNKNTFRIQFENKSHINTFLKYLYNDSSVYLDRKYEKYINFVCRAV